MLPVHVARQQRLILADGSAHWLEWNWNRVYLEPRTDRRPVSREFSHPGEKKKEQRRGVGGI